MEIQMKNYQKSFVLMICLLTTFMLQAQVSIGIRGGYQKANVNVTEGLDNLTPEFKSIDAFSLAAVLEVPLGYGFHFQPEIAYTKKGFRLQEGFTTELFNFPIPIEAEAESSFNYLEVPLLMKYQFGDGKVNAYITAGPSVGYATSGRLIARTNLFLDIKLLDTDIDLDAINYERVEWSAIAGAGMSINTVFGKIFTDVRYQHGFTELYDIPVVDERIRNKSLGINAGILIPISNNQRP